MFLKQSSALLLLGGLALSAHADDDGSVYKAMINDCVEKHGQTPVSTEFYNSAEQNDLLDRCLSKAQRIISAKVSIEEQINRLTELRNPSPQASSEDDDESSSAPSFANFSEAENPIQMFAAPEPTQLVRTVKLEHERSGEAIFSVDGKKLSFLVGDEVEDGWVLASVNLKSVDLIKQSGGKQLQRTVRIGQIGF